MLKKMRHSTIAFILTVLVFSLFLTSAVAITSYNKSKAEPDGVINAPKTTKVAKVNKPSQIKGLKKVKVGKSSVKIKFNKVKGASGYQILIYQRMKADGFHKTPIVFYKNTKKTTYTIKNLMPGLPYKIKVRAYRKDKNGKVVYGKMKSIDVKTTGRINQTYIVCNTCIVAVPNGNVHAEHYRSARKIHNEVHAGYTISWR